MNHKWRKLGQLFDPSKGTKHPKLISHAANPLAVFLENDVYRIFYSARDKDNRSSVGAVDVDLKTKKIVKNHLKPFFEHGPENSFYASGVSIGNCYETDRLSYILFMGWQNPSNGDHWRGDIGRLIISPDLTLELDSETPFMGSDETDPISLSYPWVVRDGSRGYTMWYGSTKTWDAGNGEMVHVINSAMSEDGHHWRRQGLAVPYRLNVAQAFSRPTVVASPDGNYEMWFSYRSGRGEKYRIGYARSSGGHWELHLEDSGIGLSPEGWDSEMIEYPFVFDHKGDRYMLYNGNGFGRTGFGLAILENGP